MELVGVVEIRGMGLMVGVEFEFETKSLVEEMLKLGVIANATAGNVLRMVPPLNISRDDLRIIVNTIVEAAKNK
jgi:acetylornithine/N-succinyldiaminopimelate aminotransferase